MSYALKTAITSLLTALHQSSTTTSAELLQEKITALQQALLCADAKDTRKQKLAVSSNDLFHALLSTLNHNLRCLANQEPSATLTHAIRAVDNLGLLAQQMRGMMDIEQQRNHPPGAHQTPIQMLTQIAENWRNTLTHHHCELVFESLPSPCILTLSSENLARLVGWAICCMMRSGSSACPRKIYCMAQRDDHHVQISLLDESLDDYDSPLSPEADIALKMTYEMVDLYAGSCQCSRAQASGMMLRITLPLTKESDLMPSTLILSNQPTASSAPVIFPCWSEAPMDSQVHHRVKQNAPTNSRKIILVIAEQKNLCSNIKRLIEKSDHCAGICMEEGAAGLRYMHEHPSDAAIIDGNLSAPSALSMLSTIRHSPRYQVIRNLPIIILNTENDYEGSRAAYRNGADVVLSKPLDAVALVSVLDRLLNKSSQINNLDASVFGNLAAGQRKGRALGGKDLEFKNTLNRLIEQHYRNPDFRLRHLADRMHKSPRQVQRNIESCTGSSFSCYLRLFRLKKAREKLLSGENPGQIAHASGFNSHPYFSRCFKELFGVSPSEYKVRQRIG